MIKLYFDIVSLLGFLSVFGIGVIVFVKRRNSLVNKFWFLSCIFASIWSLLFFLIINSPSKEFSLILRIFLNGSAILVVIFWLHFIYIFLQVKQLKTLRIFYFFTFLILIYNLLPSFINDMIPVYVFNYYVIAGTGYYFFTLYFLCIVLWGLKLLWNSYITSVGIKTNQIKYIGLGSIVGFMGGGSTFLLSFNVPVPPFLFILFAFFPLIILYAIIKYRLMDIRLVISKSILYFFLVLFVALSFTFVTFSTAQFLEGKGQVAVTLVVSLVIVIFLDPLKHLLAKWTDKFFYKGKIDYQEVLRQVGQAMARELDLSKLLDILSNELSQGLKLKQVHILIAKEGEFGGFQSLNAQRYMNLTSDGVIASYLKQNKKLVIADELPRRRSESKNVEEVAFLEKLEKRMDELGIALVMPIFGEDQLTALFLIESKLSGGAFTQEDLNFFEVLSPQVATALEKSKLFEEVQQAKENLEQLVEQRTADLQERNRYLTALQTLINLTTRSLDFQKVMQTIADGINENLNFIGGILSFVDTREQCISIKAMSTTPLIQKAIAMLPQDPFKYCVSLNYDANISVQAIKQRKIVTSDKFYDIVAPALTELVATGIQKLLGMKSIVAVPVYSEEQVIGVINVGLAKPAEQITPVETEMMKALADQVGIVYRNLTLYNEIQKANLDLKSANVRLTQLDQAKSEFLSIASHQLRTPLTGIKGYLSMVLEGDFGESPPRIKKVVSDVFQATDRLARLVNIFLNVSRIESGKFEIAKKPLSLVELIKEVTSELRPAAENKNLELFFHEPKKLLPLCEFDRERIKDVVLNLVDNAIKYTPSGKIEVTAQIIGQAFQVAIKDTGIGMKAGEAGELFKKFVRGEGVAKINTGGSGLGLYIAKKIVEAHGGKIWAESAGKGMGSSFIFTLPMA